MFAFILLLYPLINYLNKLESPSPNDALCQMWLKMAQWFWRRTQKCEKCTKTQTDKGQISIKKAHISLQFSCNFMTEEIDKGGECWFICWFSRTVAIRSKAWTFLSSNSNFLLFNFIRSSIPWTKSEKHQKWNILLGLWKSRYMS